LVGAQVVDLTRFRESSASKIVSFWKKLTGRGTKFFSYPSVAVSLFGGLGSEKISLKQRWKAYHVLSRKPQKANAL
jgi:hypothetical protein